MDKELRRIERMVKKTQRRLKLASYRVKSHIGDSDGAEYAEIIYDHPKRTATIVFNRKRIDDDLEETIVHELLHLFISKYFGVAEELLERQRRHRRLLKKYQRGEERAIVILASLLTKTIFK